MEAKHTSKETTQRLLANINKKMGAFTSTIQKLQFTDDKVLDYYECAKGGRNLGKMINEKNDKDQRDLKFMKSIIGHQIAQIENETLSSKRIIPSRNQDSSIQYSKTTANSDTKSYFDVNNHSRLLRSTKSIKKVSIWRKIRIVTLVKKFINSFNQVRSRYR